ncbi:hypothetical protein [Desulfuromonas acetoxidans]|uniref:Uncharacterized protein n=1 Tax=Desulfuromonas acetoxidans (strain DSM 684 / 11070) TaxID=281689 RepID=Q1JWN2_DESA6|nr:hypothetical protein [Desulfuromonas acetoxidans]EAT14647.1 conserved hypothetical protein [Desulfuromonas acetoxidans DSM 684]
MPHIVLENIASTEEAFEAITPFAEKTENGILKVTDKYFSPVSRSVLIETLVIEEGQRQNFFIQLSQKKNAVTVRLFPLTDPEKTVGVKQTMAIIAKQIKNLKDNINYGKTNLEPFLID